MTVRAQGPDGRRYEVRRTVVRLPGGQGWRMRWRGPRRHFRLLEALELGDLADIPVVGGVIAGLLVLIIVVVLAITLPFLLLGLLEALVLGLLAVAGLAAATLMGRPIVIRVDALPATAGSAPPAGDPAGGAVGQDEPTADPAIAVGPTEVAAFAVVGWGASREGRDRLVDALAAGADLRIAAGHEAVPLDEPR